MLRDESTFVTIEEPRASPNEVSLANGVSINGRFPDATALETAYQDLRDFLAAGGYSYARFFR